MIDIMGIFDTYIDKHTGMSIQLKDMASMTVYYIGDRVDVEDGIYFALEGMVVVNNGCFVAAMPYESGKDKWGNNIQPKLNYFRENIVSQKDVIENMHRCLERNKNAEST